MSLSSLTICPILFLPMSSLTKCPCLLSQFVPVFSHNMSLSSLTKRPCLLSQYFFYISFFCLRGRFPSLPWDFLLYFTMILQRIRIIVVDAGFEPGTSAPEVWCAVNKPPHLLNKPPHLPLPTYLYLSTYISHNMSNCPCLLSQNVPVFSHNMSYFVFAHVFAHKMSLSSLTICPCLLSQYVPVFSHKTSLSSLTIFFLYIFFLPQG